MNASELQTIVTMLAARPALAQQLDFPQEFVEELERELAEWRLLLSGTPDSREPAQR